MSGRDTRRAARTIWDFVAHVLVVCPGCRAMASVRRVGAAGRPRFVCTACGRVEDRKPEADGFTSGPPGGLPREGGLVGEPFDPYFRLPVWLQASCAGHTLWAYNAEHLGFLRDYVEATLRERPREGQTHYRNKLLESRLPGWMTSAKNRARVLAAIDELQRELESS